MFGIGKKPETVNVESSLDAFIPPPPSGAVLAPPGVESGKKSTEATSGFKLPKFGRKTESNEDHNKYYRNVADTPDVEEKGIFDNIEQRALQSAQLGAMIGGGLGGLGGLFNAIAYRKPSFLIAYPALGAAGVTAFVFFGGLLREL